jgi:hypothetical protein
MPVGDDKALIERLLEYVERFADMNHEPAGGDCRALIAQATARLAQVPDRPPTVVVRMHGGMIDCVNANQPARVILLDRDTEGGDPDNVASVDGEQVYITVRDCERLEETGEGIDVAYVALVSQRVDEHFDEVERREHRP